MNCDLDSSIPDWMIEHPETSEVFDQLGVDTSCGGKSLQYVCHQRGLNPSLVLKQLQLAVINADGDESGSDRHESPN